jgi:hypothetical protein
MVLILDLILYTFKLKLKKNLYDTFDQALKNYDKKVFEIHSFLKTNTNFFFKKI